MTIKLALLPGDGIGPEVVGAAIEVLEKAEQIFGFKLEKTTFLVGGCSIDAHGIPLTDDAMAEIAKSDLALLGAVGGPKWEGLKYEVRPERALLRLRAELGLYANLRPATVFDELAGASALKPEVVRGVDILVLRELTGGVYFAKPKGISKNEKGERYGVNTMAYSESEIHRIVKLAFELARLRRRKVTSVDKANVLEVSELWRDIAIELQKDYPDVTLEHMYVDNASMQLIRNPRQFDVLVTENLFGDILSDEAAMLTGSIGLLPSASLGAERGSGVRYGLYEPVHGSAPDIAGQGKANPIATVLSLAMMLDYSLKQTKAARAIEKAVKDTLAAGARTPDIAEPGKPVVGTKEMTKAIMDNLKG